MNIYWALCTVNLCLSLLLCHMPQQRNQIWARRGVMRTTIVILFSAIHAFGVRHIYYIWALSDVLAAETRLGNLCLLGQTRHSFSNMTESAEYRFSFLLHKAFTATTVFQNNFCIYYIVSDISHIMSLGFFLSWLTPEGCIIFDTIPLFVLIHQVKFLRQRKNGTMLYMWYTL